MSRTAMTPREAIEEMADALGRDTYRGLLNPSVDLEPRGSVSHERARKIALLSRKLTLFEKAGYVSVNVRRDGGIAGWSLTDEGAERSRESGGE